LSNLCDDLRSADDDVYKKAKELLHDNTIGQLRSIGEACMEPKLLASMTRHRSAIEKVYEADDEEWPDGPNSMSSTWPKLRPSTRWLTRHAGALRLYFRRTLTFA
jgi:hypothetical protein